MLMTCTMKLDQNHVQINSVRVISNQDPQPRYGIACIEELPSEEDDIKEIHNESQEVK